MKKHLKLRGVWKPEKKMVEVFLVHRSHIGFYFGNKNSDYKWAFVHTNFRIASDHKRPNIERSRSYTSGIIKSGPFDTLNLPDDLGNDNPNNESCLVTLEDWKHIKECVKAYNEYEFTG